MRVPFNESIYPPAPALEIRLVNTVSGQRSRYYHAVLDTGSDATVIPKQFLTEINIEPFRRQRVFGLWGGSKDVSLYDLNIEVGGNLFVGIVVIGDEDNSEILIGRNLCNQLRLLLDGPTKTVEVLE